MKIDELKEMCLKDTKIDVTDLAGYSTEIAIRAGKYHQLAFDEKKVLRFLKNQLKVLILQKWKYYSGKASEKEYEAKPFDLKVLKSDMEMFLDADKQIIDMRDRVAEQEDKIDLIIETTRRIQNASFNIKNAIDEMKFQAGDLS